MRVPHDGLCAILHAEHTIVDVCCMTSPLCPCRLMRMLQGLILPPPLPPLCLDIGRQLPLPVAVVALGKALTCSPEFLNLDFP